MSPFVADLGYNPRSVGDLVLPTQRGHSQSSLRFLDMQQVILHQCQDELEMAQATMKYFHDRNRPTYQFEPGDQVLLDTRNLDLPHIGVLGRRKLAPRFIGPYPIIRATTPDTYQIGLPPGVKLHNEFHISYLRPYQLDTNSQRLNDVPRLITRDGLQVQAIINKRLRHNTLYYEVRWYGRDVADSWEPANNLVQAQGLIDISSALALPRLNVARTGSNALRLPTSSSEACSSSGERLSWFQPQHGYQRAASCFVSAISSWLGRQDSSSYGCIWIVHQLAFNQSLAASQVDSYR